MGASRFWMSLGAARRVLVFSASCDKDNKSYKLHIRYDDETNIKLTD
jgi:hypothetical protein